MYTIIDVDQRSDEWFQARLGKITGSVFDSIFTGTGKLSATTKKIIIKLASEKITGEHEKGFSSNAMERGKELEDEALFFLSQQTGIDFAQVGFIDSGLGFGVSPDGICFDEKIGCELKCPLAHTHLEYLLSETLPEAYKAQVQGAMLVTGFSHWYFCSYHPKMPPLIIKVARDEIFIQKLKSALLSMVVDIDEIVSKVK